MSQIPDYTALGNTPTPTPSYRRPFNDRSGEIIAGAAQGVGQGLEQLGTGIEQRQKADAVTAASGQLSDFRLQNEDAFNQAKQNADPNALDKFAPTVLSDFDQRAQKLKKNANPLAQQFLDAGIQSERERLGLRSTDWANQQHTAVAAGSVIDNVSKLAPLVEADPSRKADIGGQLLAQIGSSGLSPAEQIQLKSHVIDELGYAEGRGLATQDPMGMLTKLSDPNDQTFEGMSIEKRNSLQQYAKGQVVDQQATSLTQVFANQGTSAGTKALTALEKDSTVPQNLRDEVRQKLNSNLTQLREQRRQESVGDITKLESNIATGQANDQDRSAAWGLYNKGAMDPSQLASTIASISRVQSKQTQDNGVLAAAMDAYSKGQPLDPKDSDSKAGVDMLFDGLTKAANVPPGSQEYTNRAVDIASRTGIVPESSISWARAHLDAGDAPSAARSADLIARMEESAPRAVGFGIDERTKAMADSINRSMRAGADPQTAVAMARQNADVSDAQRKLLDEKWRRLTPTNNAVSLAQNAIVSALKSDPRYKPGFWSSVPTPPLAMTAEFNQLSHDYFQYTGGNLQQAQALAGDTIKRSWGVTEVNGQKELMKFAPETMFPGLTAETIRSDITQTVHDNQVGIDASKVRIVPTDETARTNGQVFALAAPDKAGAYDIVLGKDNRPLRYQLPVTPAAQAQQRQKMIDDAMTKARQEQQNRMDSDRLQQEALEQEMKVSAQLRGR